MKPTYLDAPDIAERLRQTDDALCLDAAEEILRLRRTISDLQELAFSNADQPAEPVVERKRIKAGKFKRGTPAIERLLCQVDKNGENGCWIWQGSGSQRYGYIVDDRKRRVCTHRFSFEFHKRKLKPGEQVMHQCDNTWCVNPDHLEAGSAGENAQERSMRKRHHMQKLDASQAEQVFHRYHNGESTTKLAQEFQISPQAVASIATGASWKSLGLKSPLSGLSKAERLQRKAMRQSKLTANDVRDIRRRAKTGETRNDIAMDYGISQAAVSAVVTRRRWAHVK